MQARLEAPQPLDLVGADEARTTIETAETELLTLERQAEVVVADASRAEDEARESGADVAASTWAIVRLQRFLDTLRDEMGRDVEQMMDVATRQAAARVEEARAEAAAIRNGSVSPPSAFVPPPPTVMPPPAQPAVVSEAAPEPAPVSQPPVPAPSLPEPQPESLAMAAPASPPEASPFASGLGAEVVTSPDIAPAAPAVEPDIALASAASPPPPSAPAPAPVSASAAPDALPHLESPPPPWASPQPGPGEWRSEAPVHTETVPVAEPAKKRRRLRAVPVWAVLEVLIVVLIMVFILLRLG